MNDQHVTEPISEILDKIYHSEVTPHTGHPDPLARRL